MPTPPVPGTTHLHRFEVHKRLKNRLSRTDGIERVESEPSAMRPIRVRATIDTETFFERAYSPSIAELTIEWRPRRDRDEFRIQYVETDGSLSCGWHQDETHENLGASHFQVDCSEWDGSHRESASFRDPNAMAILETCIEELRTRVPALPDSVQ